MRTRRRPPRRRQRWLFIWMTLCCSLLMSGGGGGTAAAAPSIVPVDSAFGPNTLTRDLQSGLDWLDLPLSQFESYNSVLSQTAPGGRYAGFRHATKDEVLEFWAHAGIAHVDQADRPENQAGADFLIPLIGETFRQSENSFNADALVSDTVLFNSQPRRQALGLFRSTGGTGAFTNGINEDDEANYRGHWLVRPVPDPVSGPLAALATWAAAVRCVRRRGKI